MIYTAKLDFLLSELRDISVDNLPAVLVADAVNSQELGEVCSASRILMNCTGPYRFATAGVFKTD